ncbi:uncharacterized protein LOC130510681 isoform X2 [Raphanus sativus]|uniref:Uncharacterized protein LOC130496073 isoform X2 n=1 Tax=Raphanus sativus TaxID=3726 RepID=A0A9W3CQ16_RAPSA|nr:uncharacterized protein LOC130496073 isoform X2 [Raphanus sativus]XP_056849115.1 uncharacterized protein LOC130499166 isoform X2 [Raphanus sativus]XP_056853478.1 uncharacterized protein LOC130502706 isoform X2 [Raphanus sativus]XP_056863018.1 uncharacterized protein LOC130510586 isoform X3 [Raphanus sativus]XP_056863222.1 uncharacterized protein LOC130510681 isoform X2 [Raphanus sativus]
MAPRRCRIYINIPAVAPPSSRQDCSGLRSWEARNIASSCGLTCSSWTSTQLKNKDEDRVVKNNEGLPQPFLGSCNDRARQLQASSSGLFPCLKAFNPLEVAKSQTL